MIRAIPLALTFAVFTACSLPPPSGLPNRITGIAGPLLAIHNRERAAFGSPLLGWDPALAAAATAHAAQLAGLGRLQHALRSVRLGQGENLWIGTRGAYPIEAMAGTWASEKRHFRPGRFPANSRTENGADVGHYTQMVWPSTGRMGCGMASSARWDVLVCRYAPAGNVDGVMLGRR